MENYDEAHGECADESFVEPAEIIPEDAADRYAAYSRQLDLMEEQDGSSAWQYNKHYCTDYRLTGLSCAVLCDMTGNGEEQLITVSGPGNVEYVIKVWDFQDGQIVLLGKYLDGMNDDRQMENYGYIGVQHGIDDELGGIFEEYNDSKIFPELTVWEALEKADSIENYLISYEVYRGDPLPPEEKQNEAADKLREMREYLSAANTPII